ncbi:unnamed protein product [Orchesella dallaii]|uniref:Dynamin-1-like protein n=1 Tax=Orchesella dallaii TaxID=48710 RepID=A0ABP1Q1L0_9HEXA
MNVPKASTANAGGGGSSGLKGTRNGGYYSSDEESDVDDFNAKPSISSHGHGLAKMLAKVNPLYDVCNKLSSEGHKMEFKLPLIVVAGFQSCGKTSVLESFCDEQLLPKGDGIQTRCPIMLQMRRHENEKWVEFVSEPGTESKKYTDMAKVRKIIQNHSDRIRDSGEIISNDILTVKLFSPHVVDLTLVDLPGLIFNACDNKPDSTVSRISELVKSFISDPNSIILVVAAATENIENAWSVALAREVDPERKRTLVVITKLDHAMGSNAYETLLGKKLENYELGIFGVVNRSDEDTSLTYQQMRAKERHVLDTNFPRVAVRNGIPCLVDQMCEILFKRISETLPYIEGIIDTRIKEYSEQVRELGGDETPDARQQRFINYLVSFIEAYCGQINGISRNLKTDKSPASAVINCIFEVRFRLDQQKELEWTDEEIDRAIYCSQALHNVSGFFDVTDAYQEFSKRTILSLKPLVMKCAEDVLTAMIDAINTATDHEAGIRHPNLNNNIAKVVSDVIGTCYEDCLKYLEDYIDAEAAICKFSPSRQETVGTASEAKGGSLIKGGKPGPSNGVIEQNNTEQKVLPLPNATFLRSDVRGRIHRYVEEAKISIRSHVPRAITNKLVYGVVDQLKNVLIMKLHKEDKIDFLMLESETLRTSRIHASRMLEGYKNCKKIVDTVLENHDGF